MNFLNNIVSNLGIDDQGPRAQATRATQRNRVQRSITTGARPAMPATSYDKTSEYSDYSAESNDYKKGSQATQPGVLTGRGAQAMFKQLAANTEKFSLQQRVGSLVSKMTDAA